MTTSRERKALASAILALDDLQPLDQAEQALELINQARSVLGRTREDAIYDATREATWEAVSDVLGISRPAVNKAVTAHRRRMAAEQAGG